jgi:hypothetical protein
MPNATSWIVQLFTDSAKPLASLPDRVNTRHRIETDYARLTDAEGKPVDVLYDEAKRAFDAGRERIKQLEAKAGTLIGIVTTGFGAFALLGDPSKVPKNGFWLALGLVAFGIAFLAALLSLAPRPVRFPSLSHYLLPRTVANSDNEPRIKLDLTEAWLRASLADERTGFVKARLLIFATIALGVGLFALGANYSIPSGEKPTPTVRVILEPQTSPTP